MMPIQEVFGSDVPSFGFSTYGEIASVRESRPLFHNYSVVLCALYF